MMFRQAQYMFDEMPQPRVQ